MVFSHNGYDYDGPSPTVGVTAADLLALQNSLTSQATTLSTLSGTLTTLSGKVTGLPTADTIKGWILGAGLTRPVSYVGDNYTLDNQGWQSFIVLNGSGKTFSVAAPTSGGTDSLGKATFWTDQVTAGQVWNPAANHGNGSAPSGAWTLVTNDGGSDWTIRLNYNVVGKKRDGTQLSGTDTTEALSYRQTCMFVCLDKTLPMILYIPL